jgi:phosphorylated CTD-interacting factor 1
MTPGGAVPQTPLGPPSGGNPFGAGVPELDLHPELINIGWRKFWSKRESRWYFWNCNTGDSLWEVPPIPGRHPPGAIQAGVCTFFNFN